MEDYGKVCLERINEVNFTVSRATLPVDEKVGRNVESKLRLLPLSRPRKSADLAFIYCEKDAVDFSYFLKRGCLC